MKKGDKVIFVYDGALRHGIVQEEVDDRDVLVSYFNDDTEEVWLMMPLCFAAKEQLDVEN